MVGPFILSLPMFLGGILLREGWRCALSPVGEGAKSGMGEGNACDLKPKEGGFQMGRTAQVQTCLAASQYG